MVPAPTEVLRRVVEILDGLGIPYVIGGSFASSAYGEARSTRDADLVVDLRLEQVEALASGLGIDFYISRDAMREAIRDHQSFNAIHLESMFKVDFFVLGESAFDREAKCRINSGATCSVFSRSVAGGLTRPISTTGRRRSA